MTTFIDTIDTSTQPRMKRNSSPWLMWLLSVFFVLFQFFLQLSAGVMISQMMDSFHLTALGVGLLSSAFYFVYVILQTPAGMLVDRLGPRRLLTGGALVCGLGCCLFANSQSFELAFIGRLLMGGGSSFAFVSSLYIASEWFPPKRFAVMVGLAETVGMIGSLIGNVYFANKLQQVSWQNAMWANTIIAFVIGFLCWIVIRDKPHHVESIDKSLETFRKDVVWLVQHRGLFFNGLYTGLVFTVVTVFATFWAIPYLVLSQHVTTAVATLEGSLVFVGLALACPIMGWLYPSFNEKNKFLAFSSVLAAMICVWLIYFTPESPWLTSGLFIMLGVACSSYVFNFALANELVPKHIKNTSVGYTNTLCMITAPILQPFIGWLLQYSSVNSHTYNVSHYHYALSMIPICLSLAALLAFAIPTVSEDSKNDTEKDSDNDENFTNYQPVLA